MHTCASPYVWQLFASSDTARRISKLPPSIVETFYFTALLEAGQRCNNLGDRIHNRAGLGGRSTTTVFGNVTFLHRRIGTYYCCFLERPQDKPRKTITLLTHLALIGNLGLSGDIHIIKCRLSLTQSIKYCFMLSHVSSCPGRAYGHTLYASISH